MFSDQNGDPEQQCGSFLASKPGSFLASVEERLEVELGAGSAIDLAALADAFWRRRG